jgi:hypothetical protein
MHHRAFWRHAIYVFGVVCSVVLGRINGELYRVPFLLSPFANPQRKEKNSAGPSLISPAYPVPTEAGDRRAAHARDQASQAQQRSFSLFAFVRTGSGAQPGSH